VTTQKVDCPDNPACVEKAAESGSNPGSSPDWRVAERLLIQPFDEHLRFGGKSVVYEEHEGFESLSMVEPSPQAASGYSRTYQVRDSVVRRVWTAKECGGFVQVLWFGRYPDVRVESGASGELLVRRFRGLRGWLVELRRGESRWVLKARGVRWDCEDSSGQRVALIEREADGAYVLRRADGQPIGTVRLRAGGMVESECAPTAEGWHRDLALAVGFTAMAGL